MHLRPIMGVAASVIFFFLGKGYNSLSQNLPLTSRVPPPTTKSLLMLSLRQALELALKQNPQIQIANLRILESRGFFQSVRSGYLPQVNARLSNAYQTTNLRGMGVIFPGAPGKVGPFQSFDVRPSLAQAVLDLSLWKGIQAARERVSQSQWDAASLRESTLFSVLQLYMQVLQADSRLATSQARLRTAEALLNQTRDLLEAGTASRLDEARAEVQFQNETRTLAEVKRDREITGLLLLKILGGELESKAGTGRQVT
jgi:outer membrane protein